MNLHENHVIQYKIKKINELLDGRSLQEIKRESAARAESLKCAYKDYYAVEGERVYFSSISTITNKKYTGYGVVQSYIVKDYNEGYALYRIKADDGKEFEVYNNNPNPIGEFVHAI